MILSIDTSPSSHGKNWEETAEKLGLSSKLVYLAEANIGPGLDLDNKNVEIFRYPQKRLSILKKILEFSNFSKKICRFFGMFPFETVMASGWDGVLASIILKLRFNSNAVWHFSEEEWASVDGFWMRRLTYLFCDRLILSSDVQSTGAIRPSLDRVLAWKSSAILIRDFSEEARLDALKKIFPAAGSREIQVGSRKIA